jgi:16S rRNA (guanine1207-N2)-methyltransferase
MDLAVDTLLRDIRSHRGDGLWAADEHFIGGSVPASCPNGLDVICNRYDLYQQLTRDGWQASFSDFDCSRYLEASLDRVYYRVSKEKAVTHHVINQAFRLLKPGGMLVFTGAKSEGVKTYFDKARTLFGEGGLEKIGKGYFRAELQRCNVGEELLEDQNYRRLRPVVEERGVHLFSKPGVFGWDKIDKGSAFLVDNLSPCLDSLHQTPQRVLDLGCGYGYLLLMAHQRFMPVRTAGEWVATDNSAAALAACDRNARELGLSVSVLPSDAGSGLEGHFDLILCNPPFHQGFSVEGDLTDRFLRSTRRLLSPRGQAVFVVNAFIPLERKASGLFPVVERFAENGSFKLVRLAKG